MSQSSVPASSVVGASGVHSYALASDLAKLSLPSEYRDECRTLAWVNSICFLFLLIGLVGIKAPEIIHKAIVEVQEQAPVVFIPPEEQPKVQQEVKEEEPPPQETAIETPQVMTVVAAADAPNIAFAVPVQGAVAVAKEARFATPPPPANAPPPAQPKTFIPGQGDAGTFPWPKTYPREAMAERAQGTVTLFVVVETNGVPTKVELKTTSGHSVLDRFASQWVKDKWRWMPRPERQYYVPFQFKLQ